MDCAGSTGNGAHFPERRVLDNAYPPPPQSAQVPPRPHFLENEALETRSGQECVSAWNSRANVGPGEGFKTRIGLVAEVGLEPTTHGL